MVMGWGWVGQMGAGDFAYFVCLPTCWEESQPAESTDHVYLSFISLELQCHLSPSVAVTSCGLFLWGARSNSKGQKLTSTPLSPVNHLHTSICLHFIYSTPSHPNVYAASSQEGIFLVGTQWLVWP